MINASCIPPPLRPGNVNHVHLFAGNAGFWLELESILASFVLVERFNFVDLYQKEDLCY